MFKSEGNFQVIMREVVFSQAKFAPADPTAFDVCIRVEDKADPSQTDWWRGEVSKNYGKAAFADKTQAELTFKTLRKLGFESDDLSQLEAFVVNGATEAYVKASAPQADGKVFYNVRGIGGSSAPAKLDIGDVQKRMASLIGSAVPKPQVAQATHIADPVTADPFGANSLQNPPAATAQAPASSPAPAGATANPFAAVASQAAVPGTKTERTPF